MMLNARRTFLGIFGILFIVSAAFAQQDDSALTQSQFEKILEKIDESEKETLKGMHELELKMREHIDKKIAEVNTNITELKEDVANIKGQLTIIKWGITVFGAPLLIGIVVIIVQNYLSRKNDGKIVSEAAAEADSKADSEPTSEATTENREESDEDFIQDTLRDSKLSERV